jgi:hypothetical protein
MEHLNQYEIIEEENNRYETIKRCLYFLCISMVIEIILFSISVNLENKSAIKILNISYLLIGFISTSLIYIIEKFSFNKYAITIATLLICMLFSNALFFHFYTMNLIIFIVRIVIEIIVLLTRIIIILKK